MEKDGGSAFPEICTDLNVHTGKTETYSYGGMSLRDWFAGMALQGLAANESIARAINADVKNGTSDGKSDYADMAYTIADAMLNKKNKQTPSS